MKDYWFIAVIIVIGWVFDAFFKKKAQTEKKSDRQELRKRNIRPKPESGSVGSPPTAAKPITLEEIFARAGAKPKAQTRPSKSQIIHRQPVRTTPPAPVAALSLESVSLESEPAPVIIKRTDEPAAEKSSPPALGLILPVPANLLPWQQAMILHEILLAPVGQRMKNQSYNKMRQYSACRGGKGN